MSERSCAGITFVVPVHNGAATIRQTLLAIGEQIGGRPTEILVIDDCSQDGSRAIVEEFIGTLPIRILAGPGRGAAAAINIGVLEAVYPVICQLDQDVVIGPGWVDTLVAALRAPDVAAVQGYYTASPESSLCARAMGLDLEQRYAAIDGIFSDHVCTGNTAYKAAALHQVGLFDEQLGYGYDNDISYRLRAAGYRLIICRAARSVHHWRDGVAGYLRQQYGFGYGRLDVVAKHPRRVAGDSVSAAAMMAHPIVMAVALLLGFASLTLWLTGLGLARSSVALALMLVVALATERFVAGLRVLRVSGDRAAWLFAPLHLLRDVVWVAAIAVWLLRRLRGTLPTPAHSMQPRSATTLYPRSLASDRAVLEDASVRALVLIPAFNEAANLRAVVSELRGCHPQLDLLVIDDGSTDETAAVLRELSVRWLQFPQRLGIGSALRAGLRYADRLGYDIAIRIDGDGQHRAADIARLVAPVASGAVDVALGSRFCGSAPALPAPGFLQRALALCLTWLTGARVSDPTSGFYAVGPRALRVLAEHHPTGYPEPELRLFLTRNLLTVAEVAVEPRARMGGTTTLTPARLAGAAARVLLAMLVVPFRGRVARRA